MATKKTARKTKAAAKAQVEETTTLKSEIEAGISKFVEATGLDNQKARYKAQRAIAFQAFSELVESGEFDALIDRALENINELPSGWTISGRAGKPAKKTEEPEAEPEEEIIEDDDIEDEDLDDVDEVEAEEEEKPAPKKAAKKPAARKPATRRRRTARK